MLTGLSVRVRVVTVFGADTVEDLSDFLAREGFGARDITRIANQVESGLAFWGEMYSVAPLAERIPDANILDRG